MPRQGNKEHQKGGTKKSTQLRLPKEEHEVIAVVESMLGNGMFYAKTTDELRLMGHIRGKHRGRFKRANFISKGSIVMVGLRDYEYPNYKECDLLEVYAPNELHVLHQVMDLRMLADDEHTKAHGGDDLVSFAADDDEKEEEQEQGAEANTNENTITNTIANTNTISEMDIWIWRFVLPT